MRSTNNVGYDFLRILAPNNGVSYVLVVQSQYSLSQAAPPRATATAAFDVAPHSRLVPLPIPWPGNCYHHVLAHCPLILGMPR